MDPVANAALGIGAVTVGRAGRFLRHNIDIAFRGGMVVTGQKGTVRSKVVPAMVAIHAKGISLLLASL